MTFTGTPLVSSTNTKEEVIETIPCDADCRYGAWGNCEYDTSNKKWVQKRPMTAPIGAGALCVTANSVRDCPNVLQWTDKWGAFRDIYAVYGKTGTPDNFYDNQYYTENGKTYQVQYLKPTSVQSCPDNIAPDANGMCYKIREYDIPRIGNYALMNTWGSWDSYIYTTKSDNSYCCLGATTGEFKEGGKVTCSRSWCKGEAFPMLWRNNGKDGKLQLASSSLPLYLDVNSSNETILSTKGKTLYWKDKTFPYHISYDINSTTGTAGSCLQSGSTASDASLRWAQCNNTSKEQSWTGYT
jgi:hypothetical protein